MAVYTVSDVHGQYELFMKGLKKIDFSDKDKLYVIGDAIDRGPDGIKILKTVMETPSMDMVLGNHELMMINHLWPGNDSSCSDLDGELWMDYNGGRCTKKAYDALTKSEKKELEAWLKSRCLIKNIEVNDKKFCLTHSYYIPECADKSMEEISYRDAENIVWKSMFRSGSTHGEDVYTNVKDVTFITGHVPVQRILPELYYKRRVSGDETICETGYFPYITYHNLVDIDGGCAYGNKQTDIEAGALFLCLDNMEAFLSSFYL